MAGVVGFTDFWIYGDGRGLKYFAESCSLGTCIPQLGGSRIICKNGGLAWLVAPMSAEVSRSWYCREDAVTRAIAVTTLTTGWFVPCIGQLQNPGYLCRSFWDSYSSTYYWSSTEWGNYGACYVNFGNGSTFTCFDPFIYCVRAFRCVTY
jgi:hypothetical protein